LTTCGFGVADGAARGAPLQQVETLLGPQILEFRALREHSLNALEIELFDRADQSGLAHTRSLDG
jgi:hypothetical protein